MVPCVLDGQSPPRSAPSLDLRLLVLLLSLALAPLLICPTPETEPPILLALQRTSSSSDWLRMYPPWKASSHLCSDLMVSSAFLCAHYRHQAPGLPFFIDTFMKKDDKMARERLFSPHGSAGQERAKIPNLVWSSSVPLRHFLLQDVEVVRPSVHPFFARFITWGFSLYPAPSWILIG